jgi:toxin ParE1/3/4
MRCARQAPHRRIAELESRSFGLAARRRYEALIDTALHDIADDAVRSGSVERIKLLGRVRLDHIHHSRERARSEDGIVQAPRQIFFCRFASNNTVIVLRVLHELMELDRHLDAARE